MQGLPAPEKPTKESYNKVIIAIVTTAFAIVITSPRKVSYLGVWKGGM